MIRLGLGSSWNISTQKKQYPSNLSFVHDYSLNKAVRSDVSTCVARCVEACTQPCRATFLSIGMVRPRKTQDFHFRHICFFTDMFHQLLLCGCVSPTISWDFPLELNRWRHRQMSGWSLRILNFGAFFQSLQIQKLINKVRVETRQ